MFLDRLWGLPKFRSLRKRFSNALRFLEKMDFGGRNAFEQIEHISRVSANKAAALKFADFLSVFCVNMGGRVADRLQLGDIFRCYFDSNLPHVLAILETQTTFRNKIPDLPGYTTIFKKAIKKAIKIALTSAAIAALRTFILSRKRSLLLGGPLLHV